MVESRRSLPEDADGVWHPGELELQRSIGAVDEMADIGRRHVYTRMPDQHREFFAQLPFILVGTVDNGGNPWAGLRFGNPGFATSPDPDRLQITGVGIQDDPMEVGLEDAASIGLLGIELHTRRRNRMNGVVNRLAEDLIEVVVDQSFGNCPQYIQLRSLAIESRVPGPVERLDELDERARIQIESADTFFVTTYADRPTRRQVDVSHRGGRTGFVAIGKDGVLTIPDFAGNHFFATLGNILLNGRAGLLFIDFADGTILQLTGYAELFADAEPARVFEGSERFWCFRPEQIVRRPQALPMHFAFEQWSPRSLATGSWDQRVARGEVKQSRAGWRSLRITRTVEESPMIRSLYLAPTDEEGLVRPKAGQHLPIRVTLQEGAMPVMRTYTISSAPSCDEYRISIKREGLVSTRLHALRPGDALETKQPAGQFILDTFENRPAVLLGAGVGITPLLAILHDIVMEGTRAGKIRPTWLFQAARSTTERAFDAELDDLVERGGGAVHLVRVLSEPGSTQLGGDYDVAGHIDVDLLKQCLSLDDADFYLCGPPAFMQALYDDLHKHGVTDNRIHAETFGPLSLVRRPKQGTRALQLQPPAEDAVEVLFMASAKKTYWTPESGTLLDLAEKAGLSPLSSCRGGSCGSCRARIHSGSITYPDIPEYKVSEAETLLCQALPAFGSQQLSIDI